MADTLLNVVIIAKENTSLRFLRTLESIHNQIYSPIKVIVVDINEQNSMYSLGLQEDLSLYPEVKYIQLDSSLSIAETRNYVMDSLVGEYVAFINDNDTWDLNIASSQIEKLNSNPSSAASCANGILIDERKPGISIQPLRETIISDSSKWILYTPAKMSAQVIYRIKAIRKVDYFNEKFTSLCDLEMLLKLSKRYKIVISSDYLCECRLTTKDNNFELNLYLDYKKLKLKYLEYFIKDRKLTQEYYGRMLDLTRVNYMWLDYLIYMVMYFIKGPFHSIKFLLIKLWRILYYSLRWIYREVSIIKNKTRIAININKISRGKNNKIKQVKNTESFGKAINETLTFVSDKEYNEKSSLEYIFNKQIKYIDIPKHVTIIKKSMFYECKSLVSVRIPDTVLEIEAHAFQNCINLRHVVFQDRSRLNKIGDYAFAGCGLLEEINLPSSVTQIGAKGFSECQLLRQLKFGESYIFSSSIQRLSKHTFAGCTSLQAVEFGANSILEIIEDGAFLGCSNLKKVVFTSRVKSLGNYALAYCKSIESVAFLQIDSLEQIGKSAFMYCQALPYFQLPNGLEHILSRTFYSCSRLKYIKIPKKVLSINHQAFRKCSLLSNVVILTGDIMISSTAFDKNTKIKIQDNVRTENLIDIK